MADNNVVPFGRRPAPPQPARNSLRKRPEGDLTGLIDMVADKMRESGVKSFLITHLMPLEKHLRNLEGHVSSTALAESTRVISGYTNDEVRDAITGSTPLQWSAKPAHYHALAQAARDRKL